MKIIDLKENYPLVYKAALKNQKEVLDTLDDKTSIEDAFTWRDTVEGWDFWYCIEKKNFSEAKVFCPHLFEEIESKLEVVNCTTQEEWDFVFKTTYPGIRYYGEDIIKHRYPNGDGCLNLDSVGHCDIKYYVQFNYKIYSFKEWCDKFGHKPDFDIPKEWIPEIGEYAVMENAGGWGYSPKNNGCIAVITDVFKHTYCNGVATYKISGEVINPNVKTQLKFIGIPLVSSIKELICRKALSHEVPFIEPQEEVDNKDTINAEELLAEAKRRYPVGTEFLSTYQGDKNEVKSLSYEKNLSYEKSTLNVEVIQNSSGGWVYSHGKWAEIISTPTQPIWKTEDLTGRYFKALIDNPNGNNYKLGDYIKVRNSTNDGFASTNGKYFTHYGRDWAKYGIQLMPIWFDPDSMFTWYNIASAHISDPNMLEKEAKGIKEYPLKPSECVVTPKKHQVNKFPAINTGDFNIRKSKKRRVSLI